MKRVPGVAIIVENKAGEVLLLLRDNKLASSFSNHWTLIGGKVGEGETPDVAAHRELAQQAGLKAGLSFWKRYEREHPLFIVDQHIYIASVDASCEAQALQFFKPEDIRRLKIGYGFKALLDEYFLVKAGMPHVHYA